MIGIILVAAWLIPALLFMVGVCIYAMIDQREWWPYNDFMEFITINVALALWPGLLYAAIKEYREARKKRLTEVRAMIDVHYKDKWFE